jgi:hypothetical protein
VGLVVVVEREVREGQELCPALRGRYLRGGTLALLVCGCRLGCITGAR